ncbi:MAG: orotate phosphoribosyltransferase [Anaerolineae bacterium]|nr:orotate phosphoribosyltransferase [Candidatus Roseilinea sp.]MDW8451578.1 orotate phosphoribosyltransferase [Anaerolineae bacterium]
MTDHSSLINDLFDIGCMKFGQFKLKSGLTSPIYIDLRLLVSHPPVLKRVAQAMAGMISQFSILNSQFDRLAAIPYAGLPIGVAVALETGKPLIYPRREVKDYGTGRLIEGEYHAGETVLLVDDLITRGTAKLEALQPLREAGLIVNDVLVVIDREQGGREELAQHGIRLHAIFTLSRMLDELAQSGRLDARQRDDVLAWLRSTQ